MQTSSFILRNSCINSFIFIYLFHSSIKPNIVSRHNVVYVEACSFDNPLGGFVPGTKSTNKILRRSLLCKSRNNRLIRPSIPRHSSGESSRIRIAQRFRHEAAFWARTFCLFIWLFR